MIDSGGVEKGMQLVNTNDGTCSKLKLIKKLSFLSAAHIIVKKLQKIAHNI